MIKIIWRTLKDKKLSLFIYSASMIAFTEIYVALFPTFSSKQAEFDKILQLYPDQMFKALGMDKASFTLTKIESFLATEQYSLTWPIIIIVMAISFGGSVLAGEIEKGTIETLLSQPISRIKLFFSRYLAGLIYLVTFTLISVYAIVPLAAIHNVSYRIENFNKIAILAVFFAVAVFGLSMLASSFFSEKGNANFAVGGTLITMYVLNLVSSFKDNLKDLKYFSFFHYYDYSAALTKNTLDQKAIWVFLGVAIIATLLGAYWFNRRDIAV
jgi:ABC-2 type transport system permease protein